MTTYLIRSILCLALLLVVYLVFLEKEKMHRFNRWYLLCSVVFACIVPLLSITIAADSLTVLQDNYFEIVVSGYNQPDQKIIVAKEATDYLTPSLWIIYLLIASLLLIRFTRNFYKLLSSAANNRSVMYQGTKLVLLKEKTASYSFLNNIFISEQEYTDHSIEKELLTHELTHVKEKHSWDLIFIELLQVIFWFNPLFHFYKKAIQRNHEYLADDSVIKSHIDIPSYQYLLLHKMSSGNIAHLASNFNYSSAKKRLVMMTRTSSKTTMFLKQAFLLPVFAIVLFAFSSKEVLAKRTVAPQHANALKQKSAGKKSSGALTHPFGDRTPFTKEGISQAALDEYISFQNKYKYTNDRGQSLFHFENVPDEEKSKMESVFKKMNRQQQESLNVVFFPPMTPIKMQPPTEALFDRWKKSKSYSISIGDKKIRNEELNNYNASDFAHYDEHFHTANARKITGHGVEINLMTAAEFKDMNDRIKKEKHFSIAWLVVQKPGEIK
ncbi:MAG: M56 family metallopeptidase [Bacteroidota bacterium]